MGKGEEMCLLTLGVPLGAHRFEKPCPDLYVWALLSQGFPWWENAILKVLHSCSICSGAE